MLFSLDSLELHSYILTVLFMFFTILFHIYSCLLILFSTIFNLGNNLSSEFLMPQFYFAFQEINNFSVYFDNFLESYVLVNLYFLKIAYVDSLYL